MDINPYEFEAPEEAMEMATFHQEQGVELVLFSSAWLSAENYPSD